MPKELERELKMRAKGMIGEKKKAYTYGTMNKKPKPMKSSSIMMEIKRRAK